MQVTIEVAGHKMFITWDELSGLVGALNMVHDITLCDSVTFAAEPEVGYRLAWHAQGLNQCLTTEQRLTLLERLEHFAQDNIPEITE